jgi:hypothetical protein
MQRLIDFGVYRLTRNQEGRIAFQLHGNGYRVAAGHTLKLELRGRAPNLYRPSNEPFTVDVTDLRAVLPTKEGRNRAKGIGRPPQR